MQTIVSPPVHSEDEHAIVALLSDESTKQAVAIQGQLLQMFGEAIWLQQPPALHITLMEIICDTEYKNLSRQEHFAQWYESYNQIAKETLAGFSPFDITFDRLIVSQRAIIIKAADTKPLNDIRERLLSEIRLPEGTKIPPDITHCSLARFTRPIDLENAIHSARDISVNFVEHVTRFAIVKDLGPPDFNGIPMQTYPLSLEPTVKPF